MSRLLISTSTGTADATRASIPFHIAANGAGPTETDCEIVLMGDATELAKAGVAAGVRGVGVPPLADLLDGCRTRGIRLHV